jgi:hypothetical protein
MSRFFSDAQLREMVAEFEKNGYLRIERALSAEQIVRFNAVVDRHLTAWPGDWIELSESFCEGTNVLPHTADFDEAIENRRRWTYCGPFSAKRSPSRNSRLCFAIPPRT